MSNPNYGFQDFTKENIIIKKNECWFNDTRWETDEELMNRIVSTMNKKDRKIFHFETIIPCRGQHGSNHEKVQDGQMIRVWYIQT